MNKIKLLINKITSIFIPPLCMKCGKIVLFDGTMCDDCYKTITFYNSGIGYCYICGKPITAGYKEGEICAECLSKPPIFKKLRAAIKYNGHSKPMILGFKHGDRTEFSKPFAKWMTLSYGNMNDIDLIIPVPLHKARLLKRKYNQAAMLALEISKITKINWSGSILKRHKNTVSQGNFRAKSRHTNVKGVFEVSNVNILKNKKILLIDDVYTTGATAKECAKELLKAGAKEINILVLART